MTTQEMVDMCVRFIMENHQLLTTEHTEMLDKLWHYNYDTAYVPALPLSPRAEALEALEVSDVSAVEGLTDIFPQTNLTPSPAPPAIKTVRPPYKHATWPSPIPRLIVNDLGMTTNRRCTHMEALTMLTNSLGLNSIDEFLALSRTDIAKRLYPSGPQNYYPHSYKWRGMRKFLYDGRF